MKLNKLDLPKIISDFMFKWIEKPEEKANVIFNLKHSLTPQGFEKYIQYYFNKIDWCELSLNWNTNDFDGWIDVIWNKWNKKIIIQCKKYSMKDITEDQLRSFIGWVYVSDSMLGDSNTKLYYATTSKFTGRALIYANKANIECIDFATLYTMQSKYSLEQFRIDIKKESIKEYDKSLTKEQLKIPSVDNWIFTESIWDREVLQFLKQVRRDVLSKCGDKKLYDIATNKTLDILSRKRPHNFEALKKAMKDSNNIVEYNKLNQYWRVFICRLKYISKQ